MAHPKEEVRGPQISRMVEGRGMFLDDIKLPDMCYAAFVRSLYPHAKITRIHVDEAMAIPGAIGLVTPDEVVPFVNPIRPAAPGSSDFARPYDRFPLPPGKVTFVGEPILVVAAETPHIAEDMVDAITIEYEPIPALTGVDESLAPGAPVIHEGMSDNVLFYREFGGGDVDKAFQQADVFLDKTFNFPRQTAVPLEGRGIISSYDRAQDRTTIWTSTRMPHTARASFSAVLGIPEHTLRVISPDVGGEFGIKATGYPEAISLAILSKKIERPVKWAEDRMENLIACAQAHEQRVHVSVAAASNGKILGIRSEILVDQGAHALGPTSAGLEPMTTGQSIIGCYRIENYLCQASNILTNKCPGGAYRGVGTVQGIFVIERIMDMLAQTLNLDPAEVRNRNFIQPEDMPYNTAGGRLYDSGDYPGSLDKLLALSDYEQLRELQKDARSNGELFGIGIACFVEHTSTGSQDYIKRGVHGLPAFDSATIRVDPRGNVTVGISARSTGQSHDRVFANLTAQTLGVPYETIRIVEGDTDSTPFGSGTGVSRSAVSSGGAIRRAANDIKSKILELARFFLNDEEGDLDIIDGEVFVVSDPTRRVSFSSVAAAAYDASREISLPDNIERGLHITRTFDPPHQVFGNGAHLAVVRINPESGLVEIEKYFVVEDCGTILDHGIVDSQVIGGVAMGIGNALYEELKYDDDGQFITGSLMDYLLPTSLDIPEIQTLHTETPSPFTEGGVKGVGEAGTVGAYSAVSNAVADALVPLNVDLTEPPVGPERVWRLINSSRNN